MNANAEVQDNEANLLREDRDGIATLTLKRPEKFNALSAELMDLIQGQLDQLAGDKSIRVVILAASYDAIPRSDELRAARLAFKQELGGAARFEGFETGVPGPTIEVYLLARGFQRPD